MDSAQLHCTTIVGQMLGARKEENDDLDGSVIVIDGDRDASDGGDSI
jgi:hypothetical protein